MAHSELLIILITGIVVSKTRYLKQRQFASTELLGELAITNGKLSALAGFAGAEVISVPVFNAATAGSKGHVVRVGVASQTGVARLRFGGSK
jgi:hypothetical protein